MEGGYKKHRKGGGVLLPKALLIGDRGKKIALLGRTEDGRRVLGEGQYRRRKWKGISREMRAGNGNLMV